MDNEYLPQWVGDCRANNVRLKNLEKGWEDMAKDIKHIEQNNDTQNEILAKVDTMMEFIIRDRQEEKVIRKEEKEEQRSVNKEMIETLKSMSQNLVYLNSDMDKVKDDIVSVKKVQQVQEKRGQINILDILTNQIGKVLGLILFGSLVAGVTYFLFS